MDAFDIRIAKLDPGLFDCVESQTTAGDRRSLLALHLGIRQQRGSGFVYLEIGSAFGGSLQALVADPVCAQILSIDPRPQFQPDERGKLFPYPDNSTARMIELLRRVPGAQVEKIKAFEAGTDTLPKTAIGVQPDFCLVDGEHTDLAVARDARFCLSIVKPDGCVAFHDANIIYRGLHQVVDELKRSGRSFRAYILPDCVFVIELGQCQLNQSAPIRELLLNNHQGYLWSLMENDHYRELAKRPILKWAKTIDDKFRGLARRWSNPPDNPG